MQLSPVDVVNQALMLIAARVMVTSINPSDGTQAGDTAAVLYAPKIQELMRAAHWNCFRKQDYLTLLKSAAGTPENPQGSLPQPPIPFNYEYLYPTDCIAGRFILAKAWQSNLSVPLTTGETAGPLNRLAAVGMKFVVGTDVVDGVLKKVILCDVPQAQLVYTANIEDPSMWDPSFVSAASATLGAWFVNPLSANAKMLEQCVAMAKSVIMGARLADGNEGVTSADHIPDWIQARSAGVSPGLGYDNGWCAPWGAMSFPGSLSF